MSNKILVKSFLYGSVIALLFGCGPSIEDARRLGFESVEQMKVFSNLGFKSRADFDKLGFPNIDEYKDGIKVGFINGEIYKLKKIYGFESKEQYKEYIAATPEIKYKIIAKNASKNISVDKSFECLAASGVFRRLYASDLNKDPLTMRGVELGENLYFSVLVEHGLSADGKEIAEKVRGMVDLKIKKAEGFATNEEIGRVIEDNTKMNKVCAAEIINMINDKEILKYRSLLDLSANNDNSSKLRGS